MSKHDDFQAAVLALAPTAYWTFQGLAPGALLDVTGNGHDLTGSGGFTVGNVCIGFDGFMYASFDGSTAFFTPALPAGLHPSRFTLVAVVQPTTADGYWWSSELNTSAPDFSCFTSAAGAYGARCNGQTPLDTRNWGFYGGGFLVYQCSYDGVFATVSINGAVVASVPLAPFVPGAVAPVIGKYAQGGHFLRGGLSDIALIPAATTAGQMANLASIAGVPTPGFPPQVSDTLDRILAAVTYRAY